MKCPYCKDIELENGVCPRCWAYKVENPDETMSTRELKKKLNNKTEE